jgi:transposase
MNASPATSASAILLPGSPAGDPAAARPMTTVPGFSSEPPDPEVPSKAKRRHFSTAEKARILKEVDRCTQPGEIAALLRREGIYSSHLAAWRKKRKVALLAGLEPKPRGPKSAPKNPLAAPLHELQRENRRLRRRLKRAETILEIQKKASELLGIPLKRPESEGRG